MNIDLNKYQHFVEKVTSQPSNDLTTFMSTLDRLDANYEVDLNDGQMKHGPDVNLPLLITACMGIAAESGEFIEIPKKIIFQGKALTEENVFEAIWRLPTDRLVGVIRVVLDPPSVTLRFPIFSKS